METEESGTLVYYFLGRLTYYFRKIDILIKVSIFNISFPRKSHLSGESSNPSTLHSDFAPTAKDSSAKETIAYICGLRARIECEPFSEHSTHSDRVTNIGYCLFSRASPLPAANQNAIKKSSLPDLNRRPTHYECVALPTEPRKLAKN